MRLSKRCWLRRFVLLFLVRREDEFLFLISPLSFVFFCRTPSFDTEESTPSPWLTLELRTTRPSGRSSTSPSRTCRTMFDERPSPLSVSSSSETLPRFPGSFNSSRRVTTLMFDKEPLWLSVSRVLELDWRFVALSPPFLSHFLFQLICLQDR